MASVDIQKPHILCVDDEPNVVAAIRRQFRKEYQVTTATGGAEALELLQSQSELDFGVIISDFNMPGMDGIEFLAAAGKLRPDSSMLMLTGRAELDVAVKALHEGQIFRFLSKPCPGDVLKRAIEDGLKQFNLIQSERQLREQLEHVNRELNELNTQLEEKVSQRTQTIRSMIEFVTGLNGMNSVAEISQYAVTATADLLSCHRVSIMLADKGGQSLHMEASVGVDEAVARNAIVPVGVGIAGVVFKTKQPRLLLDGSSEDQDHQYADDFFISMPLISVPMVSSGQSLGVLNVTDHADSKPFREEDVNSLRAIAESTAIALVSQHHQEQRNQAQEAIILALATLSEYRDPETGGHLKRLQHYCNYLAEYLQVNSVYPDEITTSFIRDLARSSPLHDIGKVGIPDHILCKPGKLISDEFEIMKTHTSIGGDTLKQIVQDGHDHGFLRMGMQIAYCHHEKWDGSGYPNGLEGQQIPLSARILSVADVYDALTSQRIYKPAFSHEKAAEIIADGKGSHFDPAVVEAFLSRQNDFAQTAEELKDQLETRLLE
ncbi:MAG: response regulator [Pseudomonadales bacterium]|nr:response regulator [Pseudomonadales bacterium]